ncbi:MAG: ParB/RepB/Spo0J family partition protein [Lachnospiraceae bacterium]|nr:ParB/RepB/Spo0J family partition protein [Lachnospiraceae bacterium]MDY5741851.1 ParB/RepB/Spo0J family partition protein [Lachnospiraceae bacterium]
MTPKKRALGQGLQALFQSAPVTDGQPEQSMIKEAQTKETTKITKKTTMRSKAATAKAKKTTATKAKTKTNKAKAEAMQSDSVVSEKVEQPEILKTDVDNGEQVLLVKFSDVEPNRQQPRKYFDQDALEELADSIRRFGMIQPILVKKKDDYYEIIAGERRWRAAKIAGLKEIPVLVRSYEAQEEMEISLIENIQRKNLNPIEEAAAYQRLLTEFSLTQEEVAARMSISRSAITNSLRLLKLDERVREIVERGEISAGHARSLVMLADGEEQYRIARWIIEKGLSVREIEQLVKKSKEATPEKEREHSFDPVIRLSYEREIERLKEYLGAKVALKMQNADKGKIEISYHSLDEFEQLMERLQPRMGDRL